jgi:hypothetical protein
MVARLAIAGALVAHVLIVSSIILQLADAQHAWHEAV